MLPRAAKLVVMSPSPSRSPSLSIVIPSRDRPLQLAATLDALANQSLGTGPPGEGFDVLVVDDGSSPALRPPAGLEGRLSCRWLRQDGQGPAAARNRGIAVATGQRILLLGDDTRPAPEALQTHLLVSQQAAEPAAEEVGVQGMIDWAPEKPITPLMDFLAPSGPQFYFTGLRDGEAVPYGAVLGSNYSAPRRWFVEEPFDEGFPAAALEDTELAYRFERRGWRSVFARRALCWHDHHYAELASFLQRQRRAGRAARYAIRRHPGLAWRVALQPLIMAPWVFCRRRWSADPQRRRHAAWEAACRWAFLRGLLFSGP